MKNFRIGARLAIGFAVVLLLMTAIAGIGVWRLQEVGVAADRMIKEALYRERKAEDWVTATTANGVRTIALMKSTDPDDQKYFQAEIKKTSARITVIQKDLNAMQKTADEEKLFAVMGEKRKAYLGLRDDIIKVKLAGRDAEAKNMVATKMIPALDEYVQSVEKVLEYQKVQIDKTAASIDANYRTGRWMLIGLGAAAVVIGVIFSFMLTTGITGPLGEAVRIAQTVAKGDLSGRIDVNSRDETGQLLQALKDMNESLHRMVTQVRQGTESIATASGQIASGNADLSARTEEQASSLEETASSMEQLTSTVRQNADNARQANQLAVTASEVAVKGGEVVSQVVDTMGSISESSKKMADIIGVIDGIAFQTNILALNAAVEAARAGEQGRGFAVVATEVRNLAQRSAAAAREIKALIDDSVDKVAVGGKLVEQAGSTMNEVVSSIKRVYDIMGEITAASAEQSDGIEQVNQAITQMDTVTQQNAALVEEAAAAAESMQDQAARLSSLVSTFRLGTEGSVSSAPKPAAKRPTPAPATSSGASSRAMLPKPASSSRQVATVSKPAPRASGGGGGNEDWEEF
ncbi:MAG: HAMP domain-containing protein [Oxalobacter sp.]|nr:MAG: HAMP domain-containing protein [Oxalobacter sp.]